MFLVSLAFFNVFGHLIVYITPDQQMAQVRAPAPAPAPAPALPPSQPPCTPPRPGHPPTD